MNAVELRFKAEYASLGVRLIGPRYTTKSFLSYRHCHWRRLPGGLLAYVALSARCVPPQATPSYGTPMVPSVAHYQSLLKKARSLLESEIQIPSA